MKRFRLRFLLQEFDLHGEEVIVGRSPDCGVTLEDPLVSRQHARLLVTDECVWIEDLGSRNGVRVNGIPIVGRKQLADGDRVRLGTQELVLSAHRRRQPIRTTGLLRMCADCGVAYPEEAQQCPHCGSEERDEETFSGFVVQQPGGWTFHLLAEVIERALSTGRVTEADRMMRRAAREVEEIIDTGASLGSDHVEKMALFALQLAEQVRGAEWVRWAVELHQRQSTAPSEDVVNAFESVTDVLRRESHDAFDELARWLTKQTSPNLEHLKRIRRLSERPPPN